MKIRAVSVALVAVLVMVIAACGGSDDSSGDTGGTGTTGAVDTTAAAQTGGASDDAGSETTAAADTGDDGGGAVTEPAAVGEAGSFSVNDTVYPVTLLNRCIPFQDEPGNIDLQALAQGQGAKLNLYVAGEFLEVSVDGSGIEEAFGSIAFGDDGVVHDSTVNGDRWVGSATVGDSLGSGDTVEVIWDVMIPAEAIDCSL